MYLINHFLDKVVAGFPAPDQDDAATTNGVSGVGSLGQQVQTCASQYGRNPNFMLVDVRRFTFLASAPPDLTCDSSTNMGMGRSSKLLPMPTE